MIETQTVVTTNKMFACFLRSRGIHFEIFRDENEPERILTFRFENVPVHIIKEFWGGGLEMLLFRQIYDTREQLNKEMDKFRYRQYLNNGIHGEFNKPEANYV
jgi:hypothetical protein